MKQLILLLTLFSLRMVAAPLTHTLNFATTPNVTCAVGDTLKFYGNANDHYYVAVNASIIINSTQVTTAPYYIGWHVVTAVDTSYNIGRLSQGTHTGKILVSGTTNLSEHTATRLLNAFPNPFTESFYIETKDATEAGIYGIDGRLVNSISLEKGMNEITLDSLPPGLYLLKQGNYSRRLIKQ